MLENREVAKVEQEPPELDEGWWAAILADEKFYQPTWKEESKPQEMVEALLVDWDRVKELHERDEVVEMQVRGYNRGGLLVQGNDLQGFVPVSHLVEIPCSIEEEKRNQLLSSYVGKSLRLKVIEFNPAQERVVFSERAAQAGEGCRKKLFECLSIGKIVKGKVTNVTEFGVFVDLGGVEGLIHVSELSWGRVERPLDILKVGEEVEVMVLQVSEESSRIALSLKRLFPNPWYDMADRYRPGDVVEATVTSIMRYGVFARMIEGIEGLIHVSSLDLAPGNDYLENTFSIGQNVKVRIRHIDVEHRRLGLELADKE